MLPPAKEVTVRIPPLSLIIGFAFLALPMLALQQAPPAGAAVIAELETAWDQAHLGGDVDALDGLWAPDITVIVPGMPPFQKTQLLAMWRSVKVVFTEYKTTDVRIRVYGNAAVVTGALHRSRDFGGRVATEDWLFTKAYAQIDGHWKVVAYHASTAP